MQTFPTLETERLVLNDLKIGDIPLIIRHASNKKIADHTQNIPHPYSEKDAVSWINMAAEGFKSGTHLIFAIRSKPDHNFMGGIGFRIDRKHNRAELGYWIAVTFWDKGYMTEAVKAVINYGFEHHDLNRFTASHFGQNPASGRVMLKNGMKKEGILEQHILKNQKYHDLIVFGINRKDYKIAMYDRS